MKNMTERWEDFFTKSYTQVAGGSKQQKLEMERCFYAGALSTINHINSMLEPGEEPTDKDLLSMDELYQEIVLKLGSFMHLDARDRDEGKTH